MAIDPTTLEALCDAISANTDPNAPARDPDLVAALAELVALDPAGYLEACVVAARATMSRDGYTAQYSEILEALRTVDVSWFHRALDLLPWEPALWDAFHNTERLAEIVDYIGLPAISRAWQEYDRAATPDPIHWWAAAIVWSLNDCYPWANEEMHRAVILQLIEDADDETIGVTAAGPLEDFFIIDDVDPDCAIADLSDRLAWAEQQASTNPRFRHALTMVWTSRMTPAAAECVDRARNYEQN